MYKYNIKKKIYLIVFLYILLFVTFWSKVHFEEKMLLVQGLQH